jgi:abortive infection bacteriophage resistance protein
LRTKVAYVLGARDPFGHVHESALDRDACAKTRASADGTRKTSFEHWSSRYATLQSDARNEDYVRHHLTKYSEPLPIWIAIEFLDFGAASRLYGLLNRSDQNAIANELGIKGGRLLDGWLKSLNYLRNTAAHHNRLWNRTPTLKIGRFSPHQVEDALHHAATLEPSDKLYRTLAATAYLVKHIDPSTRWHVNLRDDVRKFPDVPFLSPEGDMGFPSEWQALDLWRP